jgi:RNase P subunit RPR2
MQERGKLIRRDMVLALEAKLPVLSRAVDPIFDDLSVEASDGIGRKTEAPWVRIYSEAMSPNARQGFYLVIHFSANGSGIFITIGCGSTIWSGGDLKPILDTELHARTNWARDVIQQRWGNLEPFTDEIELGATAKLPRQFEKATAAAKFIAISELDTADIDFLLNEAMKRLSEIYLAQLDGRDTTPAEQDAATVLAIVRPDKARGKSQGRGLTPEERRKVEKRAMFLAAETLKSQGYSCEDKSTTESFDLLAKKDGISIKVEVKGTTSDICESLLMTRNEVELHKNEKGVTALVIVSRIRLDKENKDKEAFGGEVQCLIGWDINEWLIEPIMFQITRYR